MPNIPLKGDAHSMNFYEFLKFRKILKILRILKLPVMNSRSMQQ